jgi:hypothetical protein
MASEGRLFLALLAALSLPARAQLDLGSPEVPREKIAAYMEPFYRLAAAAAGSDHFLPFAPRFGWHAGLDAALVPLPGGAPFDGADIRALPLFRAGAGMAAFGAGASARGFAWRDPRVGDLATFGAALGYGREVPSFPLPLTAALRGGWDHFAFSSDYVYRYRGSPLGLADQDVPGDYAFTEEIFSLGLCLSLRRGSWGASLQGDWEWVAGEFEYLYYDPRSGNRQDIVSKSDVPGLRAAAGLEWRGFRAQLGFRSYPYLSAGWAWVR